MRLKLLGGYVRQFDGTWVMGNGVAVPATW